MGVIRRTVGVLGKRCRSGLPEVIVPFAAVRRFVEMPDLHGHSVDIARGHVSRTFST